MEKISPQAGLVLDYLRARPGRSLTPLAAHTFLGIASLTTRIAELRKAGHGIRDGWEKDRFKRRFKVYWLATKEDTTDAPPIPHDEDTGEGAPVRP